ncbi:MAG: hypothetical protein AB8B53_14300 [Flavobacteriales bacterium]
MKYLSIITILCINLGFTNYADKEKDSVDQDELKGTWSVDLRTSADSAPYFKSFEVGSVKEKKFEGQFYDSKFKNGLINTEWDRVYFAFSTRDSSSEYYHTGYILKGKMYGQTFCPKRDFTMPWTAVKNK